jgi:hypothetical protein
VRRSPRPVLYAVVAVAGYLECGGLLRHNSPLLKVVGVFFYILHRRKYRIGSANNLYIIYIHFLQCINRADNS